MPGLNSVDGLNSGLNTKQIVDSIIKFERSNAVLLEQEEKQKQIIITSYQALQAKFLALNTDLSSLKKAGTFDKTSIDISDDTVLSATADGRVGIGSYDLQVLSLARNHQLASQGFDDESMGSFGTGNITIQVGDGSSQAVVIDENNNSLLGIKKAINDANIGVTASIINDGTSSNSYRLILTSDKTGAKNKINITSSLSGGSNLNFSTATFDNPETVSFNSSSTSQVSLGLTAAYTGSENKTYTFTVAGSGSQTVGTDNITINWTDGTNSGAIVVTQADTEYELVGAGADGLKLSFSAGTFNSGDTFQVNTFAPLLQEPSDAKISLGSAGGTGSPITITSSTNTFTNAISNLTLNVNKETAAGESVTINTDVDVQAIKNQINTFIKHYNDVTKYIDDQNKFTKDSESTPPLFGDYTIWTMENSLRNSMGSVVDGIKSEYNQLYAIGIRTTGSGNLAITDPTRLEDALKNNLDDVIKLFTNSANSSNNAIEFLSASPDTVDGVPFNVDVTQVATHGGFNGSIINDPTSTPLTIDSSNDHLKLKVDGLVSDDIVLADKTYNSSSELVSEIQTRIDNDSKIGDKGVTVEWVTSGTGGYLKFNSPTYGSTSKVEFDTSIADSSYTSLGISNGTYFVGDDVAGTINGEEAKGQGQILSGNDDNKTTAGLKLKVSLNSSQLTSGAEGSITITKGIASREYDFVNSLTKSKDGMLDRRISAYQNQIDALKTRVNEIDARLAIRRDSLMEQFNNMETVLGQLKTQGQYLTDQLAGINNNWQSSSNN